jgi:hypothetical protein
MNASAAEWRAEKLEYLSGAAVRAGIEVPVDRYPAGEGR